MFWLKGCPKCGGDLYQDHDGYGPFIACLQCGHELTQAEEVAVRYAWATGRATRNTQRGERMAVGAGR